MRSKITLAIALVGLLFFSGCISSELSIQQRQKCIELSSRAYVHIPRCESQQECFAKVENEFFGFNETVLSTGPREEIYSFKNNLAASWLYFNKANKNVLGIKQACSSLQETGSIPVHINELNHSLRLAFKHSDSAFENAFSFVLFEKQDLEREDVELITEEPLFDSFVAINNNLNDLESGNSDSQTFAGHYLDNASSLQQLVSRTGFSSKIVQEKNLLDLLEGKGKFVSEEAKSRSLKIPFLSDAIDSFTTYLNQLLKLRQAALVLPEFPSFEFFQVYNNLSGTENSSAKKFASLVKANVQNRLAIIQRNVELEQQVRENVSEIELGILELSTRSFASSDQDIFQSIYSLLGKDSSIEAQRFGIQNMSGFNEKASAELSALNLEFFKLQRASVLNELSLGKKTSQLKGLVFRSDLLSENIRYLSTEFVDGTAAICRERIAQISSSVSDLDFPESTASTASDLRARIKFKIGLFNKTNGLESLTLCKDVLLEFDSLQLALSDFYSFTSVENTSFEECMAKVQVILSPVSDFDLSDFARRFEAIKSISPSEENISTINHFCTTLEMDLDNFLRSDASLQNVSQTYLSSRKALQDITALKESFPDSVEEKDLLVISEKLTDIDQYFTENELVLEKALPVFSEIESQLDSLNLEINSLLSSSINNALTESFSAKIVQDSVPVLGERSNAIARFVIENPARFDLQGERTLVFPLEFELGDLIESPSQVISARALGNEVFITVSHLPVGLTILDFASVVETSFTEHTELLSVDRSQAVFKKTISINSDVAISKLKAEILLLDSPLETKNVRAFFKERSLGFLKQGNVVSLDLENVNNGEELLFYFSVQNPISLETEILESSKVTETNTLYRFKLSAANNLPIPLEKVQLTVPLEVTGNTIIVREFVDENGKNVKFNALSGKNITFWPDSLFPSQRVALLLLLEVEDAASFWQQQLESQKDRAQLFSTSQSTEVSSNAQSQFEKLSQFQESFFESGKKINELVVIGESLDKIEAEFNHPEQLSLPEARGNNEQGLSLSVDTEALAKLDSTTKRIDALNSLLLFSIPSKIVQLTALLESVQERDIIKAKYVSPTSLSRVKGIGFEVEQLLSPTLKEKFNEFNSLYLDKRYPEALSFAKDFDSELTKKEEKARAIDTELSTSLKHLEEDAFSGFNSAANLFNRNSPSEQAIAILEESEFALKSGDFLKSITLSRNAVGMLSLASPQPLPIFLLPIVAAGFLVFAVRFKKKKGAEVKSQKLKRVLSAWESPKD
ncbi:MAG: hypothetical protein QGI60_05340 [archaeon]|nr:hypothetical protein [archaeon]